VAGHEEQSTGRESANRRDEITRRDFVGGTLIGAGAALLGAAAPAYARRQSGNSNVSMTGLGPDWTGPGGIGDYAGKNGNTADVVNAAHADIRNDEMARQIVSARITEPLYDLIVIGAGISGLTAAYSFQKERPKAKVLVLDMHAIFGGEAKQNDFEVDGYRLTAPQGSTGIVVPFTKAGEAGFPDPYMKELGFPAEFVFQEARNLSKPMLVPRDAWCPMHVGWEQADAGFFYDGHGMVKNPWRNGFRDAPISDALKKALVDLELFRTPPVREDWDKWLDSMTYREFLLKVAEVPANLIDEVCRFFDPIVACMGCGLGADVISAYSAYNFLMPGVIAYSRYQNGGADPTDSVYLATFPGGNTYIAKRFLKLAKPDALSGGDSLHEVQYSSVNWDALDRPGDAYRLRLSSTAVAVQHEGDPATASSVRVVYHRHGKVEAVRGKTVICAGQQHANKRICRDLNAEYREAMNAFNHSPILVLNVALRNWKFLDKMGVASVRWFDGFGWWTSLRRNLVLDGQETQPLDPTKPVVLTQYIPFLLPGVPLAEQCRATRMQLFAMSFADIEARVREQFTKMFGPYGFDADRDIAGIIANRQGHAYFVGGPGFFFGKDGRKAPKDVLREPFHRIAFSHSELSGAQDWGTAALEGTRAAQQALAMG
jgi:spermidine dehydrogenase